MVYLTGQLHRMRQASIIQRTAVPHHGSDLSHDHNRAEPSAPSLPVVSVHIQEELEQGPSAGKPTWAQKAWQQLLSALAVVAKQLSVAWESIREEDTFRRVLVLLLWVHAC
jgi:hypothetical protein